MQDKDKGAPLLEECQCYRSGEQTGIADYFIRVHDRWIPIEAKINISAEKDILAQVARYTQVDAFVPTRGSNRKEQREVNPSALCLIADQAGVYVVYNGQFFKCSPAVPLWRCDTLTHAVVSDIRAWLQDNCL